MEEMIPIFDRVGVYAERLHFVTCRTHCTAQQFRCVDKCAPTPFFDRVRSGRSSQQFEEMQSLLPELPKRFEIDAGRKSLRTPTSTHLRCLLNRIVRVLTSITWRFFWQSVATIYSYPCFTSNTILKNCPVSENVQMSSYRDNFSYELFRRWKGTFRAWFHAINER